MLAVLGRLGAYAGGLGRSWAALGALLGRSWALLGRSWAIFLRYCACLRSLFWPLGPLLALLALDLSTFIDFWTSGLDFRRFFSIFRDPAVTSLPWEIAEKT